MHVKIFFGLIFFVEKLRKNCRGVELYKLGNDIIERKYVFMLQKKPFPGAQYSKNGKLVQSQMYL